MMRRLSGPNRGKENVAKWGRSEVGERESEKGERMKVKMGRK